MDRNRAARHNINRQLPAGDERKNCKNFYNNTPYINRIRHNDVWIKYMQIYRPYMIFFDATQKF